MFKFLEDHLREREKEFISHVSNEILSLIANCGMTGTISLEAYKEMRMNSYEQKYIEPYLSPEALIWRLENAIKNVFVESGKYKVQSTYDDYLVTDGINELLKRYKKLVENT